MAMIWYDLKTETPETTKKLESFMKGRRLMVRRLNGNLFCCIGSQHQKWLADIIKDYNTVAVPLKDKPDGLRSARHEEYKTPCGQVFWDPLLSTAHQKHCDKCRGRDTTVAKIEPGTDFNLDGVVSSLEATRNRMASQLEYIDGVLNNLREYRDAKVMIEELGEEAKGRIEAVKVLMRDKVLV